MEVELELGATGAAAELELPPSDDDEPPEDLASLEAELDELSAPDDELSLLPLSPLFWVSGLVFEPAAPPLP